MGKTPPKNGESPRGVADNVLDCDIDVNEFELHSCYYIHFRLILLGKVRIPYAPNRLNSTFTVLLQE